MFASDRGQGDAERASIMSQAGTYFARKGARIVCLTEAGTIAIPLVTSARAAGGDIVVVSEVGFALPRALSGVPLEQFPTADAQLTRVAALADAFVGLPGSLASISNLYLSWLKAGGRGRRQAGAALQPQQRLRSAARLCRRRHGALGQAHRPARAVFRFDRGSVGAHRPHHRVRPAQCTGWCCSPNSGMTLSPERGRSSGGLPRRRGAIDRRRSGPRKLLAPATAPRRSRDSTRSSR